MPPKIYIRGVLVNTVSNVILKSTLNNYDLLTFVLINPSSTDRTVIDKGGHVWGRHNIELFDTKGLKIFGGFIEGVEEIAGTRNLKLTCRDYKCLLNDESVPRDFQYINQRADTIISGARSYSSKVQGYSANNFSNVVPGTFRKSHQTILSIVASVCEMFDKDFWVDRVEPYFYLYTGTKSRGSQVSPQHTWSVGSELRSVTLEKLGKDIINRQKVFGAGDGINQIQACVPYINQGVADSQRSAGFGGYNANCIHSTASASQAAYGVMEGKPYTDVSIVDVNVAIQMAKTILDTSLSNTFAKISVEMAKWVDLVLVGDWVRIVSVKERINQVVRISSINRSFDDRKMDVTFISPNEYMETVLDQVQRDMSISNTSGVGATNCFVITFPDNCDTAHPYEMIFQLPSEVKYIDRVKFTYLTESYRGYSATLSAGGRHSHNLQLWHVDNSKTFYRLGVQNLGGAIGWTYVVDSGASTGVLTSADTGHTHPVDFNIYTQYPALSDMTIAINDGSGFVDRTAAIEAAGGVLYTSGRMDINLTPYFTANGGVKRLRLTPYGLNNGECRIIGLLTVMFYMESR